MTSFHKSSTRSRRSFSQASKRAAVDRVSRGQSVAQVANSLQINRKLVYDWLKKCSADQPTDQPGQVLLSKAKAEQLKVRIRQVEDERDRLLKAIALLINVTP